MYIKYGSCVKIPDSVVPLMAETLTNSALGGLGFGLRQSGGIIYQCSVAQKSYWSLNTEE